MILNVAVAAGVMAAAAKLIPEFANWVGRHLQRGVEIKIGSRHVVLDLAKELPATMRDELISKALQSAAEGDDVSLNRTEAESKAASDSARMSHAAIGG